MTLAPGTRVTRRGRTLDLFACAGGASTGIALLDRRVVGVDHDPDACATHAAAGHPTIRADLTAPVPVSGPFELVWASPPCTAFSMAGKGEGRDLADVLVSRILAEDWSPMDADPAVWLVLPTMAAILDLAPVAVAMENVPPTLPVMHACAQVLERHGYRTAVGVLSAECFGVAQTRKRAFLLANRTRPVALPEPTHQGYGDEVDDDQGVLFGEPLLPWVSMAEALGWVDEQTLYPNHRITRDGAEVDDVPLADPSPTVTERVSRWKFGAPVALDRRCQQGPKDAREPVPPVEVERPAPSMTVSGLALGQFTWKLDVQPGRENAAVRSADESPSVAFGKNLPRDGAAWTWQRPSTTLVSSFRPDVVAGPGYRQAGDGPRQDAPGSISITVAEAARLQAFPASHPWQGSRTSVYRQIGNAVPPPVAAAVVGAALGVDWRPAVAAYLAELYSAPLNRAEEGAA